MIIETNSDRLDSEGIISPNILSDDDNLSTPRHSDDEDDEGYNQLSPAKAQRHTTVPKKSVMSPTSNSYEARQQLLSEEVLEENHMENTPIKNMQAVGHIVGLSSFNSINSKIDLNSQMASHKSNRSNSLHQNMRQFRKSRPDLEL